MHVNNHYSCATIQSHFVTSYARGMAKKTYGKTFLREWRRQKPGRTLDQVAEHIGISQPQLGRIERGEQAYNQTILETLAELYGCAVPDLLMRNPTEPTNIWSLWDRAKPGERRVIQATVEAILKSGTEG